MHDASRRDPTVPTSRPSSSHIAVIGCGHVGLVMAAGFARLGHEVVGVDRDQELVDELGRGVTRIHEAGLPELLAEGHASGRLRFTTDYDEAVGPAGFVFLAVDTPPTLGGASDLRNLRSAARAVAASMNGHVPIIVNKSTSPVGTADMLESTFTRETPVGQAAARVVANPEFLRQGRAVHDFFEPDRIVVGSDDEADARAVAALYEGLPGEIVLTSRRTAEMIKYAANTFLATRVSFINEIARLCEATDVDVDDVIAGISQDERIGGHFFRPGIGFGGSCLPKDTAALRYVGEAAGVPTPLLAAVQQVNEQALTRTVRRLREALAGLDGRAIAAWGLTFKADTEDVRESPAIDVVRLLINDGASVIAYDPSQPAANSAALRDIRLAPTALDAVDGADALIVLTDWPEFAGVPPEAVATRLAGDLVLDGRNALDADAVRDAGLRYLGVGRGRRSRRTPVAA